MNRIVLAVLSAIILVIAGCATSPEIDWRFRRAVLEIRPSENPEVIGYLTVAGRVDAYAFTPDALWIIVAAPTKRGLPVNRLAKINLHTNRFVDLLGVGGFSKAALASSNGSLWVAEGLGGEKLHRIDPETNEVTATIDFPRNPIAVAVGGDAIWVLAAAHATKLGRILVSVDGLALFKINPASNTIASVTRIPESTESTKQPTYGRLTVAGGSLWVSTRDGEVLRIDPKSGNLLATFLNMQDAAASEPTLRNLTREDASLLNQAAAKLGFPAYAVAAGMGSFWAFSAAGSAAGDQQKITWITRLQLEAGQ